MSRYYHVIGLEPPGTEILIQGDTLRVDITHALCRPPVHNDVDLLELRQRGQYLWVSGGGTYLLNGRYLLTVQRPMHAKVNPGRFSLFTGRADHPEELMRPDLLVRELFEELLLYSEGRLYKPVCEKFQRVIDRVYEMHQSELGLDVGAAVPLPLRAMEATKIVRISNDGDKWESPLDFHVSSNREINVLFVLSGEVELPSLRAQDGEYHIENGKMIKHERNIYLYDVRTALGQNISDMGHGREKINISMDEMTEHMRYLVETVSASLEIEEQARLF